MFESKYLDIADELESGIASRKWKRKLPGVAVLSRKFNVNSRTVSKALHVLSERGMVEIKPWSGTFIRQCPRKKRRYGIIGVMGMLHGDNRRQELIVTEEQARKKDYHILNVEHCKDVFQVKPDALLDIPVDGFIFTNSTITPTIANDLTQAGIPFVSVNRISNVKEVNWVDYDHETAHRKILEHLIELGHRRIGFVSFRASMQEYGRCMRRLYQDVLEPKGLWNPMLYVDEGDQNEYYQRYGDHYFSIYGMEKASYLMNMNPRPTALILFGERTMAQGGCTQLQSMGFRVPDDVSVVGYSQISKQAEDERFLTMISASASQKVRRATDILLDLLESPQDASVQELLRLDIFLRDSVGPCKL